MIMHRTRKFKSNLNFQVKSRFRDKKFPTSHDCWINDINKLDSNSIFILKIKKFHKL